MKRMKDKDWTRVLQERLQDASLPLESEDIATFAGGLVSRGQEMSQPAARRMGWWPYALAGVAAAVVAALLLLRPVSPTPDRLAQQTVTPPAQPDTPVAQPGNLAAHPDDPSSLDPSVSSPARPGISPRKVIPAPTVTPDAKDLPDSNVIPDPIGDPLPERHPDQQEEAADQLPPEPSSNAAPDENRIPDDRTMETVPLPAELALTDLTEISERPRRKAGRISLRLNAATAETGNLGKTLDYNNSGMHTGIIQDSGTNVIKGPETPVLPISVGVSLSIPLSRNLALTAGLDYMQRGGYGEDKTRQLTLHYLGIPVELLYYFNPDQRWRFYLGAGLHAAKSIHVSGGEALPDPILFSGNLMAGTDIRLLPGVRFYLAPSLSAPFNHSAYANTWDAGLRFQLLAGLSFDLK